MAVLTTSWFYDITVLLFTLLIVLYSFYRHRFSYWKKKNVFYVEPKIYYGNFYDLDRTKTFGEIMKDLYDLGRGHDFTGVYLLHLPLLIPRNLDIIKNILIKDFNYFHDRGVQLDEEVDPLNGHLFNMEGKKWKNLRNKLSPTFTSGKMKMMFPTVVECGEELQKYLQKLAKNEEVIEMKDMLARFTTDVISSCAFGIKTDSINNPDSEFRKWGKKIFERPPLRIRINALVALFSPKLAKYLKLHQMSTDITDFFMGTVRETADYRKKNNVHRNDFFQLLLQLMEKGKIDDSEAIKGEETEEAQKFTFEQAAAQAFVFFAAGFETSSTTMMFCLYELALNQDIQEKLQQEIDRALAKYDGKISYEAMFEMEYMDRVISETLRKYPPVPIHFRQCTKEYNIPGSDLVIEKKGAVWISLLGINNDPDIYPQPERFDPDRFTPEEKAKRHSMAHTPFGDGPRICIGERFALMQTKIGLSYILSKYKLHISAESPVPMKFDIHSFILTPENGMHLKITNRN